MPLYILLALIAAAFNSIGGLLNKQAMAHGIHPLRIYALQAGLSALLLAPSLCVGGPLPWQLLWQPAVAAVLWFGGSCIYVHTLRSGDLSLIGPVAGIKPIFNALLISLILRTAVPGTTWLACGLSALALFVMRTPASRGSLSFARSALQTLAAMLLYALTDLCLQRWAPGWSALRFAALVFLGGALLAAAPALRAARRAGRIPANVLRLGLTGAFCTALPGLCIGYAIGRYGRGAEVNVAYSVHVLFTLLIVWFFGRRLGNREYRAGRAAFLRRLAGALILLAAVVLVLNGSAP